MHSLTSKEQHTLFSRERQVPIHKEL